jgi:four helix bundle protein
MVMRLRAAVECLGVKTPLRVLEVARSVAGDVTRLIELRKRRLLHRIQLTKSVQSIVANIREAHGRDCGPDRNQFLRFARASAEETDEHLRTNFEVKRIDAAFYWRQHNRLAVTVKMLNGLMSD